MIAEYIERLIRALESGPSVTDWISTSATVVTALVAGGALWFAAAQIKEAKASRELSRALDVERAQPYVVAYTEPSAATELAIDLVIKNFGATAARDVQVTLNPWPQRDEPGAEPSDVGIPNFPILAPSQEWRTSWVWGPDRHESDLPNRHEGEVRYRGIGDKELTSPVVLDLSIYTERRWVEVRTIHDVGQSLRDIQKTIKKWTEGLAGLRVYTHSGDALDRQTAERAARLIRAGQQRQAAADEAPAEGPEEGS